MVHFFLIQELKTRVQQAHMPATLAREQIKRNNITDKNTYYTGEAIMTAWSWAKGKKAQLCACA